MFVLIAVGCNLAFLSLIIWFTGSDSDDFPKKNTPFPREKSPDTKTKINNLSKAKPKLPSFLLKPPPKKN